MHYILGRALLKWPFWKFKYVGPEVMRPQPMHTILCELKKGVLRDHMDQ